MYRSSRYDSHTYKGILSYSKLAQMIVSAAEAVPSACSTL